MRITRLRMVNCFLVVEDDGLTLVDTGIAGSEKNILRLAKEVGGAIKRIVLTHAHIDHMGSLDRLCESLPNAEVNVGEREAPLLRGDLSLRPGESGGKLFGYPGAKTKPSRLLQDGDRVGSLQAISCEGHTPGHLAFLDVRDGTLIAGDSFVNQAGLMAAGEFKIYFPLAWLFAWNPARAAASAEKLCGYNPERLAVGHGKTIFTPRKQMEAALARALQQHGSERG